MSPPAFEYELHPVGPTVTGGPIVHPIDRARDLLEFYRDKHPSRWLTSTRCSQPSRMPLTARARRWLRWSHVIAARRLTPKQPCGR